MQNKGFLFLPVDWLLKYDFETHKLARAVTCPTLVLLSKNDEVVGYETGLKLAQQFNSAQTISIEEAGHNNQAQFETYWNGFVSLFTRLVRLLRHIILQ